MTPTQHRTLSADSCPSDQTNVLTIGGPNRSTDELSTTPTIDGRALGSTGESQLLLGRRLRYATLVIFLAYSGLLGHQMYLVGTYERPAHRVLFITHVAVALLAGSIGCRLWRNRQFSVRQLRRYELALFGSSTAFCALLTYVLLVEGARRGYLLQVTSYWLIILFAYALIIPNTWRRAAVMTAAIAATPVLITVWTVFVEKAVSSLIQANADLQGVVAETCISMFVCAVAAVWGAVRIRTLRREAFEARQLGQYRLEELLSRGSMGDVYKAEHLLLKRPCVIKLIHPEWGCDSQSLQRFQREVAATASLTHLNTIDLYDYGSTEDGIFYYVMEHLPGMTLGELVERHGPLPPSRSIYLLAQVCDALSEAHDRGLVHRDIKPSNIFVTHRGGVHDIVKLLDFGIVKATGGIGSSMQTAAGTIIGTPLYLSPEQVSSEVPVGERSDIYSLGAVAYFLLTGHPPFTDDNAVKVAFAHLHDRPDPLELRKRQVPAELQRIVLCCLEKSPGERFESVYMLRTALLNCRVAGDWSREAAASWWHSNTRPGNRSSDE